MAPPSFSTPQTPVMVSFNEAELQHPRPQHHVTSCQSFLATHNTGEPVTSPNEGAQWKPCRDRAPTPYPANLHAEDVVMNDEAVAGAGLPERTPRQRPRIPRPPEHLAMREALDAMEEFDPLTPLEYRRGYLRWYEAECAFRAAEEQMMREQVAQHAKETAEKLAQEQAKQAHRATMLAMFKSVDLSAKRPQEVARSTEEIEREQWLKRRAEQIRSYRADESKADAARPWHKRSPEEDLLSPRKRSPEKKEKMRPDSGYAESF